MEDKKPKDWTAWRKLASKLCRLIDVKSVVTIALVIVLCVITLRQLPTPELFNSAVMLVLGFFFGKNLNNNKEDKQNDEKL